MYSLEMRGTLPIARSLVLDRGLRRARMKDVRWSMAESICVSVSPSNDASCTKGSVAKNKRKKLTAVAVCHFDCLGRRPCHMQGHVRDVGRCKEVQHVRVPSPLALAASLIHVALYAEQTCAV